jgi:hypothetical protein
MSTLRIQLVMSAASLTLFAGSLDAAMVVSRTALNTLLGGTAVNENFENFNVANGASTSLGGNTALNSTSVNAGQGPGLIVPGMQLLPGAAAGDHLLWQGAGQYGFTSKNIGVDPGSLITIDFTTVVNAFGMDLLTYGSPYPNVNQVTVYAIDDTTVLGTFSNISLAGGQIAFFGYENILGGGLGKIVLQTTSGYGPVLDNVTFGAVPEPTTMIAGALLLLPFAAGAVRRMRKNS